MTTESTKYTSLPEEPPAHIVRAAIDSAKFSPCAKSNRGAVAWVPAWNDAVAGAGHNAPPVGYRCSGTDGCRKTCAKLCEHAEKMAMRMAQSTEFPPANGVEMVHVKVVDGDLVPSGGPSCWGCSRDMLVDGSIRGVWLYHRTGWRRYTMEEFHAATLQACEIEGDVA